MRAPFCYTKTTTLWSIYGIMYKPHIQCNYYFVIPEWDFILT